MMNVFFMHIGAPGSIDVGYTISKKRKRSEMLSGLPPGLEDVDASRTTPDEEVMKYFKEKYEYIPSPAKPDD